MQHRADMAVKDREIDDLNQQLVDLTKEYEELSEIKVPTNNNIFPDNLKKKHIRFLIQPWRKNLSCGFGS